MKSGFTSFELIMVMAVSAIMMTALFAIYNQVTRNMIRVERFIFEDTQILALKNRFEKDVSGMSAIWFTKHKTENNQNEPEQGLTTVEKEQMKSKYFYSINKDGHLDIVTFLTTNALQSYGVIHHRFVRVVYQLEVDRKHEGLFRLTRKEIVTPSENIDDLSLQQGQAYELVTGIKSMQVAYQLVDKIELVKQYEQKLKIGQQSERQVEKKDKPKSIVRVVKQWDLTDIAKQEKKEKKEEDQIQEDTAGAAVPQFIEIKIVFGKTDQQLEKNYKLEFVVPCAVDNIPKNIVRQTFVDQNQSPSGFRGNV